MRPWCNFQKWGVGEGEDRISQSNTKNGRARFIKQRCLNLIQEVMRRHLGRMIQSKIYFRKINMKAIWRMDTFWRERPTRKLLRFIAEEGWEERETHKDSRWHICVYTHPMHSYYPVHTMALPVSLHLKRQRKQVVSCMNNCCWKYQCQGIL